MSIVKKASTSNKVHVIDIDNDGAEMFAMRYGPTHTTRLCMTSMRNGKVK